MVAVPIITTCILFLIHYQYNKSIVRALANTWIAGTFFVWLMTETLSAFKIWTPTTVFALWLLLLLLLLFVGYKNNIIQEIKAIRNGGSILQKYDQLYRKWLVFFGIYFLFVLIVSALSGQYNMDSMAYHLPRIMRWIQNKSVGHFAPGIEFQVRYPCLTEYLVSQIYLFGCNDRLANLIQTIAYLVSAVMVFGISRKIGASPKVSFTASFIYLMIPMALVQAFSTQTDDVAGLFLLIFVLYILDFIQADKLKMDKQGAAAAIRLALTVMLGYLCKPTICFVMLTFFVWMCIVRICKKDKFGVLIKYVIVGGMIAVLLYLPLYMKSYQTYTTINQQIAEQNASEEGGSTVRINSVDRALAPDVFNVKNALLDPSQFAITCLQNLGRNSTSICFPVYNENWEKIVVKVGEWLGKDVSAYRTQTDALFFYQDTASNPCVMILTLLVVISLVIRLGKTDRLQTIYIICAVTGFLVQCGLMGYTQYRTRYLVGAMAVLCPAIAITIENLRVKDKYKDIVIAFCIFSASIGGINAYSYELPRIRESFSGEEMHQYFIGNIEDEYVYRELSGIIDDSGYKTIGLDGTLYMEYPLWRGVKNLERLENVNVSDIYFAQYEDLTFIPDCIVKVVSEENEVREGDLLECHGVTYECIWSIHWYQTYFCLYAKG